MASTTVGDKIIENQKKNEVSREEIQSAIAKAVELRALHAALMQSNNTINNSPSSNLRFSSVSQPLSHLSAHDYPVFTPTYEDEPLPGYQQLRLETSQTLSEYWDEYGGLGGEGNVDETTISDYKNTNSSSRKGFPSELLSFESPHICNNHNTICRNSLGDFKSVSSCNKCKPALISSQAENNNMKNSNIVVPLTDSLASVQSQPRNGGGGLSLSWLFPRRLKNKKTKNGNSLNTTESEGASQIGKDLGIMSVETLKKELMEANESRASALMEAEEMKSSLGELKQKLEYLETYCEELNKALRQAKEPKVPKDGENSMPVSEEVMVEGFLQIVGEARLSVKQFCKTLVGQIEETDMNLVENLNLLLQPYKLSLLNSKHAKAILYHLEAIINESLYQDFENCVFQKNGSPKLLDPHQDRQAKFSSFVALRNLSWNEVLRKGTKYYSEEFSKFCDLKMSFIIATLNWTRPWPELLLQSFFVAAKCIWLLHLLAFSFNPPLGILRVEENRSFDSHYMDDIFVDRQRLHGSSRVKIMVMPGFYVLNRVLKCKVLCRYKTAN